jgi:hypothetical protein
MSVSGRIQVMSITKSKLTINARYMKGENEGYGRRELSTPAVIAYVVRWNFEVVTRRLATIPH